jgi:predicted nucleotidyltransferase
MAEKSYLDTVGEYLKKLDEQGLAVRFGVIFGSWIKGNPDQWSDIDLIVVSPRFDRPRNRRDVDLLWRLAARVDSRIEPIPCGEKQWEEDDSSAIVEIARREGKRVDFFPQEATD